MKFGGIMVYAAILAGGSGQRMQTDTPKQFININNKPVFIYSIEAFAANKEIDHILLAVGEDFLSHAKNEVKKYCPNLDIRILKDGEDFLSHAKNEVKKYCPGLNISILKGGEDRHNTLINILEFINKNLSTSADTILLTHDAARPFLDDRIISENIKAAREHGACTTAISTTDTIFKSEDGSFANAITNRQELFNVQTPQSFNFKKLYQLVQNIDKDESEKITDACSIFILNGQKVALIKGKPENIKITYKQDIIFANEYAKTLNTSNKP